MKEKTFLVLLNRKIVIQFVCEIDQLNFLQVVYFIVFPTNGIGFNAGIPFCSK